MRLASNSERSAYLCLLGAKIKGVGHLCPAYITLFLGPMHGHSGVRVEEYYKTEKLCCDQYPFVDGSNLNSKWTRSVSFLSTACFNFCECSIRHSLLKLKDFQWYRMFYQTQIVPFQKSTVIQNGLMRMPLLFLLPVWREVYGNFRRSGKVNKR